ncbi:MAG TPA: transporter substrate-binding domain-containing protein [Burkholderiaceae bacterium]|nr:transporter substrate-binding domain-containing protein [Burkholderiaceae bacterium]
MITAIIVVTLSFSYASVYADEIVIYGGEAFKPQSYLDNGEPAGMIPALFKHLSKESGDSYKLILLPWKRAVGESTSGHGGITSFTRTVERSEIFDFSEPLFRNRVQLIVLKDKAFEFTSLDNLRGKIIGLPLGSSFGDAFDQAARDRVFSVDPDTNQTSRIKKLFLGRIDIAVIGRMSFNQVLKSDPQLFENRDKFMLLTNAVIEDPLYLAFPKSMHMQPALQRFNKALISFKKTKAYQDIVSDYAN